MIVAEFTGWLGKKQRDEPRRSASPQKRDCRGVSHEAYQLFTGLRLHLFQRDHPHLSITTGSTEANMATERLSSVLRHITPGKSPLDTM